MGLLSKAVNKYIPKGNNRTEQRINKQIAKLSERELNKLENRAKEKAGKQLSKVGINPNDLLSDEALSDPRGALTRVARNRIESELRKHNIPPEILDPETIQNPDKLLSVASRSRIGTELEKHGIPREILHPDTLKNPAGFVDKFVGSKYPEIPKGLVEDLLNGKIKNQQDILLHLKDPVTQRINSEIHKQLGSIKIGNTNLSDIVNNVANDINEIKNSSLILYATTQGVTGLNNKIAISAGESESPAAVIQSKTVSNNKLSKDSNLQYPLGDDAKHVCWMVITCFEYQYDPNDILGNRRVLDAQVGPKVKTLYEIKLPMPGSLASTFTANWSDYANVWAKILRSSSVPEGQALDSNDFIGKIMALYDNQAVMDTLKVGALAGTAAALTGSGIGGSISAGINESLNYLRVAGGVTVNPMTQATYVGANIRNHKFSFTVTPRNKHEQLAITKIIELLENSQLPAKRNDLGGILLDFPDTFNIRFTDSKGVPINGILEVPDSIITSISVTRSNGTPAFRVSKDFFPISYQIEINFKEMQNLVRQDLKYLRQSSEQYQALHSGGTIPGNWDPNKALEIKPFDIPGVSGSSDGTTGELQATGNMTSSSGGTGTQRERVQILNGNTSQDSLFKQVSAETGVPANWLKAIAYQESRFNPNARNSTTGAAGMMQTMPIALQDLRQRGNAQGKLLGSKSPYNAHDNVRQGAHVANLMIRDIEHFKLIQGKFSWNNPDHVKKLTSAYNAGVGTLKKALDKGHFPKSTENVNYVKMVTGSLDNNLK